MTHEEAKYVLTHSICSCQYGTSPTDCDNAECKFGKAVRILCGEEKSQEEIDAEMEDLEAKARWICCPMCDRETCNRRADDCDVKIWLEKHKESSEETENETDNM